ncbi:MAG: GNAT family N-acetyltransferase [Gammaproteobacteria bacterium]|nr:GNAT family N-acetyltransferase [Gammaproteobacteria bacterium]
MKFIPQISISQIKPEQWPKNSNPLASYELLKLFEDSGVVTKENGWQPLHLCLYEDEQQTNLLAVIPSYVKSHSYGEYVFDWTWANYYQQLGLDYYPKLLTATPLTPCLAPKILGELNHVQLQSWATTIAEWLEQYQISSWHLNFPDLGSQTSLKSLGFIERSDIQFHWRNQNYASFEDYLANLKPKKRRNIQQERRKVSEAGWRFHRKLAKEVSDEEWELLYQLYTHTFEKKAGWGQLNLAFFQGLRTAFPENAMLIFAKRQGQIKAASLFFISDSHLYGRYWGAFEQTGGLHFESCYYQGIEYAIEKGLEVFEPGAQGEHKLARGFDPIITNSYHYIIRHEHQESILRWVEQEKHQAEQRLGYYRQHSAYR